jgi:hypothetical protein
MLRTQGPGKAARLKDFLREVAFTPEGVRERIQTDVLVGRHNENLSILLYRTREVNALNLLIRWFIIGEPASQAAAKQCIPADILQLLGDCGLLTLAGDALSSPVRFSPFEELWIATDTYAHLTASSGADGVLMINATTLWLLNLAIRTPCRSLLDLGTGCGVVAIVGASQFAEQVTATDLSSRAGLFAGFNAWLNERPNVEVLTGNLFQPVAGRKFERILSNPPFYVTPTSDKIFAENPMVLDGFCRHLIKQAPAHLEEGGYLQMLCEWPEIEGQPWEERLSEWFEGTGCDAVVCAGGKYDPILYAQNRLPVVTTLAGKEADYQKFQEWISYYQAQRVVAIHAGLLTIRKRSGQNWVHFERVSAHPSVPLGDAMLHFFATRDQPLSDEQLLASKLTVADGVQLRQLAEFSDGQWRRSPSIPLTQTFGLQLVHEITPDVAEFISRMDGRVPLCELVDDLAREAPVPREKVQAECLSLTRKWLDRGFVRVAQPT